MQDYEPNEQPEPYAAPYETPYAVPHATPYATPYSPPYADSYAAYASGLGAHPDLPPDAPVPPAGPYTSGAAPMPPRRRRARIAVVGAAIVAAACAIAGTGYAIGSSTTGGTGAALPSFDQQRVNPGTGQNGGSGGSGSGSGSGRGNLPNGGYGNYPWPNGGSGSSGGAGGAGGTTGTATATQSVGVVDIVTVLGYQQAEAAGTGLVVTSSGEIVTNNHVVNGATSIRVTVVSTGKTYTATVVGTDPTDDVAVIQLSGASGLATAAFGDSSTVKVGDSIVGVGNAGGRGGTPSASSGQVTALNQSVTASDENGQDSETVTGMIETNAPIEAGDSGGPLYNASGKVVGIDTAAATSRQGATLAAYAIPIDKALSIASQIESGNASSTIHIGSTGFIGVSVTDTSGGALVQSVVSGGPAAQAGIAAGDVISGVNGTSVANSTALHNALATTKPGQQVRLTWSDPNGGSHSATVTLIAGPAD